MGRMQMFHGLYQADEGQQVGSKVKTEKGMLLVFLHHALKTSCNANSKILCMNVFSRALKGCNY